MVDLVQTAANVQHAAGATLVQGVAGAAITAGMAVYLDAAGLVQPAEHDLTAVEANAVGIAVCGAPGAGQPVIYQTRGNVDLGATLAVGAVYVVGVGAGGIAPEADPGVGDFVTILGVATSTSNLKMSINASGVAHA